MAKNKTTETEHSVSAYLNAIANEKRRSDCTELVALFTAQTGLEPKMWGAGIVGFGSYHYKYESGHEGDAPLIGLASRANAITLYMASDFDEKELLLQQFGKHKTGKGCIYIQKLEDIDTGVLGQMVQNSVEYLKDRYQTT
ncbi:DUF1801 domain-containing protein [Larkinella sp. GY13]|uniref:DUF1801 domain-containing protein n=1 Tax=Larkinella sp. GY13 TaxID=3453720 RepID=UPI003EF03C31